MTKKKAIVQLGAGPIQRELLAGWVAAGLVPFVVDRSEAPAGLVPGALHLRAAIDDPDAILRALSTRSRAVEPVAVLTSTDLGVASVPPVARALGLPHASPASIAAMDDKLVAKTRLAAAGVAVPRGRVVARPDRRHDARACALEARGPSAVDDALAFEMDADVVVKPVDSSGSRGVARVRGRAAIDAAIEAAFAFGERVLVEECIEGRHLDVNGIVHDGRFELVALGHRFFSPAPACVPLYGGIPATPDAALAERVTQAMQRAVVALDYRHGPIKADAIDSASGLVLLELAARFHGDVFSFHTMRAAGLAPAADHWLAKLGVLDVPIRPAMAGTSASSRALGVRPTGAWLGIFARTEGTIEAIEGLDALRAEPGFVRWIPRLGPGDRVGPPTDNRALVGFAILSLNDGRSCWLEAQNLRNEIRVEVDSSPAQEWSASIERRFAGNGRANGPFHRHR